MTEEVKKVGAPYGNQNARKHGFYSDSLDETQRADYLQAIEMEGLDAEIALMRAKIKSLLVNHPDNVRLQVQAIESLGRLLRSKMNIPKSDKPGLTEAIGNILKDIGVPAAASIANIIKNVR